MSRGSDYKEIISRALHQHSRLTTRQETDPDVEIGDLFTDNKQVTTLQKHDWQILYGRRGTGKTTLLHKLADVIDQQENQATLILSLQKCVVDLPEKTPDTIRGLVQFEKFIMEIGFQLYRIFLNRTASKNRNKKLTRLLNRFNSEQRLIETAILNIATFAHRGTVYGALTKKTNLVKKIVERKVKLGIGSKVDVSILKGAEQFSAYAGAAIQRNLTALSEAKYQETAYIDFPALKRDFVELLDALHIKTLFILLDEWSALDRRSNPDCQIHFAEYLKRAFFGTSRICMKISAIEHESKFEGSYKGSRIGLEVGADIFVQVNLDEIYTNRVINLREFFEELIFKRLRYCDSEMTIFDSRDNKDRPVESFYDLLFESNAGFNELLKASSGIPRDFINRFDGVAGAYDYSIERQWKEHRIREVIIRHSIGRIDSHVKDNPLLRCIFDRIKDVVAANNNRVFLIPKMANRNLSSAIAALFASRLIHRQDVVIVPERVRSKYDAYFIDYGAFLDRVEALRSGSRETDAIWPLQDNAAENAVSKFVIDIKSCQVGHE